MSRAEQHEFTFHTSCGHLFYFWHNISEKIIMWLNWDWSGWTFAWGLMTPGTGLAHVCIYFIMREAGGGVPKNICLGYDEAHSGSSTHLWKWLSGKLGNLTRWGLAAAYICRVCSWVDSWNNNSVAKFVAKYFQLSFHQTQPFKALQKSMGDLLVCQFALLKIWRNSSLTHIGIGPSTQCWSSNMFTDR